MGIFLGTTVPHGYGLDLPGDLGAHAGVVAVWTRTPRLAFRGDVAAQMLSSSAVATPSCVPGAACRGYALHPDQVYSAALSAELRLFGALPRLYGRVGGGASYGRGPESTDFGTTFTALGGVGIDLAHRSRPGLSVEATYQHYANSFGTLRGMLLPAVAFRF